MALKRIFLLVGTVSLMNGGLLGCPAAHKTVKPPVKAASPIVGGQDKIKEEPQAKGKLSAVHLKQGRIECFETGTMNNDGEPLTCEPSAVLFEGGNLLVASDKKTVGENLSPVFVVGYDGDAPKDRQKYLMNSIFTSVRKIEDFSVSPDKKWSFATSAFDRFREDKAKWDAFNSFVYWRHGHPEEAQLANVSKREGIPSSLELRDALSQSMATAGVIVAAEG